MTKLRMYTVTFFDDLLFKVIDKDIVNRTIIFNELKFFCYLDFVSGGVSRSYYNRKNILCRKIAPQFMYIKYKG